MKTSHNFHLFSRLNLRSLKNALQDSRKNLNDCLQLLNKKFVHKSYLLDHKAERKILINHFSTFFQFSSDKQEREQEADGSRMVISSISPPLNKEIAIRRRMESIFTKREDDFPSLRDYRDYLEEVEDMTLKLIEGIDVAAIEAKIAKYMEENSDQILINLARKSVHQNSQAGFVTPIFHRQSLPTGMMAPQSLPLIGGDMLGHAGGDMPRSTGMTPQPLPLGGGEDEGTMKLQAERAARAGGWTSAEMSRKRAREEAFESMWP